MIVNYDTKSCDHVVVVIKLPCSGSKIRDEKVNICIHTSIFQCTKNKIKSNCTTSRGACEIIFPIHAIGGILNFYVLHSVAAECFVSNGDLNFFCYG